MTNTSSRRCAVYTRKSSEEGLGQDFNSLQAQREACEAFIKSQASEGWRLIKTAYDDGGLSGGTRERAALQQLLTDIGEGLVDIVVVYKVDLSYQCGCAHGAPESPRISKSTIKPCFHNLFKVRQP